MGYIQCREANISARFKSFRKVIEIRIMLTYSCSTEIIHLDGALGQYGETR